ncbi:hypothetical protein NQ318_009174 [Aromia moschata]|uniref:Uncharacterized protein n=1 Tax=Aromia moschata TaxID=1265417 RepID=A0AAV8XVH9_9CUCU|nr:hypothetical protein NQ318_009174 [Aromia moschata]
MLGIRDQTTAHVIFNSAGTRCSDGLKGCSNGQRWSEHVKPSITAEGWITGAGNWLKGWGSDQILRTCWNKMFGGALTGERGIGDGGARGSGGSDQQISRATMDQTPSPSSYSMTDMEGAGPSQPIVNETNPFHLGNGSEMTAGPSCPRYGSEIAGPSRPRYNNEVQQQNTPNNPQNNIKKRSRQRRQRQRRQFNFNREIMERGIEKLRMQILLTIVRALSNMSDPRK